MDDIDMYVQIYYIEYKNNDANWVARLPFTYLEGECDVTQGQ